MPVKLLTGLPGSAKSACMVEMLLDLHEKEPNRPLYSLGIDELAPGLAEPLTREMLERWADLPTGSYVFIDECQEYMPLDNGRPPAWIKALSKVRHFGIDFVLSTQKPGYVSTYVRGLVDEHVHHVRKFRSNFVATYTFPRCMPEPEKPRVQKSGVSAIRKIPKRTFGLYKSAEAHTMKMKLPRKFWLLLAVVLVLVVLAVAIPVALKHLWTSASSGASSVLSSGQGALADVGPGGRSSEQDKLRRSDYVAWVKPRVSGLPWTAPAFDGQSVRSEPEVYCIAVDDGRCSCVSEQGTKIVMDPAICRRVASDGVYNPFRRSPRSGVGERRGGPEQLRSRVGVAAQDDAPLPSVPVLVSDGGAYRRGPSFSQSYVPPEAMPANQ